MADVASLVIEITAQGAQRVQSDIARVGEASQRAEAQVNGLTHAFKLLGGAYAVTAATQALKDVVMLGARYETLGATMTIMANNAGFAGSQMREFQTNLEKTGISALAARQSLQIMAAAQLNLAKATELGRVAQDAATLAGINSSDAFNNLVRGITTGEVRIIRHMGIMVNFKDSVKNYADANHKAVNALNSRERAEARMIGVLAEGAKRAGVYEAAMTTAGKQMLSMQRYTENLQVQIGELFNPTTNAVVFAFVDVLKQAHEALKAWKESGELAVWAASIKRDVMTAWTAIKTFGEILWALRVPLEAIGVLWAASRIGAFVQGIMASTAALMANIGVTRTATVMTVEEARAKQAAATQSVRLAMADLGRTENKIAGLGTQIMSNQLLEQERNRIIALIIADEALVKAKADVAAATLAANGAMGASGGMMAALGGPVGIAIAAIGLLVVAWNALGDSAETAHNKIKDAAKDAIERINDDITRMSRAEQLRKDAEKAAKDLLKPGALLAAEKLAEIKKAANAQAQLEADFNRETKKLRESTAAQEETILKEHNDRMLEIQGGFRGKLRDALVKSENSRYILESNANRRELDLLVNQLILQQRLRKDAEKAELASGAKPEITTITDTSAGHRASSEAREIIKAEQELMLAQIANSNEKKEKIKLLQDEARLAFKIRDIEERGKSLDGKPPERSAKGVKTLIELAKATENYTQNILRNQDAAARYKETSAASDKAFEEAETYVLGLDKAIKEYGKTEEELVMVKLLENSALKAGSIEYQVVEENLRRLIPLHREMLRVKKEEADNYNYAKQIQNKEGSEAEMLAKLEKARHAEDKATGAKIDLTKEQYLKAWVEIMMKGDSVKAHFVQNTAMVFDKLGEAFGNFVTGTRVGFKDLLRSMADEIAKFYAKKAVQQLFMLAMNAFGGGGGTPPVTYANGSLAATVAAGNASYAGPRAAGGPVSGSSAYMVGENGPELFTPTSAGTITPNHALTAGSKEASGPVTIAVTIHNNGEGKTQLSADETTGQGRALAQGIRAAVVAELTRQMQPGGTMYANR